jgi:hypothetical protein
MIPGYEISIATTDDVQGMLALQEVNLPDKGGSLSVRLTVDWFNDAILEKSALVCRYDGKVVGYLMGTSLAANAHIPIIQAMLCAFPRRPTVTFMVRFAWPKASVARASPARCLRARLPGRPAMLFVRADNAASLRAQQKMGMHDLGTFTNDGVSYIALTYSG